MLPTHILVSYLHCKCIILFTLFAKIKDAEKILIAVDNSKKTFLHYALEKNGTPELVKRIISLTSVEMLSQILKVPDWSFKTALDSIPNPSTRKYLKEVCLAHSQSQYHLESPPTVLIFYSTKNRQTRFGETSADDAEAERECVERFFLDRRFPCRVKKDPTSEDIINGIREAQDDQNLSGLIVFCMSHGEKGLLLVEGNPNYILVQDIMTQMCCHTEHKPKVSSILKYHLTVLYQKHAHWPMVNL